MKCSGSAVLHSWLLPLTGRSTREAGEVGSSGAGGLSSFRLLTIPAHSEKRVDWTVDVVGDGQATVRMTAETDEESDAVEQSFPALTYGVQKFLTTSGVMQADQNKADLTVAIPKEHKPGSSALLDPRSIPSLAATTLDALPYLADYPLWLRRADHEPLPAVCGGGEDAQRRGREFRYAAQASDGDAGARTGGNALWTGQSRRTPDTEPDWATPIRQERQG